MKKTNTSIHLLNLMKKVTVFLLTFIFMFSVLITESSVVFAASVKAPKISSVTAKSSTSVIIKWSKVSKVTGYVIYQKKGSGSYKEIKTLKDDDTTSFTKTGLSAATKYAYKVSAYKLSGKKKTYSAKSAEKSVYTKPATPKITSVKSAASTTITLKWGKVSNADGYVIYSKSGSSYKTVATVKSGKTTTYTVKKLTSGKKYTYAIASYITRSSKKIYSAKSAVKSATTLHTHKYGAWKTTKKATCTAKGIKERTCSCGAKETQSITALGHTGGKATCTAKAKCTRCGKSYGSLASHKEVIDKRVEPTKTETGLTQGSHCSVCGKVIVEQKTIPALGVKYHSITYRNLNGAQTPEITKYDEDTGLFELPVPEADGYIFKGWFTASQGGEIVDYIPEGSTKNYILYARWELITYNIRYFEAPQNENVATYTVEDEIYLNDPNWSGMGFVGWTEPNNKVKTEIRNGKTYYKIPQGTTGDLELTANWKLMRNIATPGTNNIMLGEYMEESGRYMFIYELGTIENVVIEELNSSTMGLYNHTGAGDFTLTMSTENTMEESIADSITKTISKSVSSSREWEESKEWAKEKSNEYSANASYGMEFGGDASPVKASIELGFGYTHSSGESWGGSETTGGSIGEETETGEEVGSCFSYLSSMTTTSEASVTISGDSPHGYYDYVQAGNIRVFGVVTYDPKDGNYYLNTYSILDNMHGIVLYYPDVNMLNNPTCETLEYHIPKDNIEEVIANSYFISYDANGGSGKTNTSVHTVGGSEKLTANTFTKDGYTFIGWDRRDENGLSIGTFTDAQVIESNLADKGEMLKLYALWSPNKYTIQYQNRKPSGSSTEVSGMPSKTDCVYDSTVTLAAAPTLSGYTFGGWYADSGCTEAKKLGGAGQVIDKANFTKDVNGVVEAYPKWTANKYTVTFDLDGGTCSQTSKQVTFDQLYPSMPTPTKSNAIFLGWELNGAELTSTTYVRTAGNHTIKAKWMSLTWSETRGNGKNKRFRMITDRDDFWTELDEDWNPNIDKKTLEDHGYTKVIITISFWVDELDQGNQRVYFATPGGKEICKWSFTSTPSDWHQYTRSTQNDSTKYVDISNFGDNMEFKTIWEAYGNGGDDWDLGETTVTLQFTKG